MENTNNQNGNAGQGCGCKMCQKWGWCPAGKSGRIVKWVLIFIVVICALRMLGGGHGNWPINDRAVNTITVSGKGEVVVVPDIATVSFGVTVENLDVSKAQTEASAKMNKIIDFLKTKGIDEKDIKTTNYSIYPRYDYTKVAQIYPYGGKQVLAAYVVSQTVEVKIRKTAEAGAILTGVSEFGVTDVSGLNFSLDKMDGKKDEARNAAIKDARSQAKVLADQLGVKLLKITSFSESGNLPIYYGMEKAMLSSAPMGMGADTAQIPVGENKITSNVTITYEIR